MPAVWNPQANALFLQVLEQPSAEREAFLQQACGADVELAAQVRSLLAASDEAGSFLSSPLLDGSPTVEVVAVRPGLQIGPYKLLQQIGEGGFGVVYMAEQSAPVKRRVAVKVIKPGMDTRQVIARFEAERQALAVMDHPNIARVLDAGATESGRPYFVMELVRGTPITQYCDENSLPVRERLELFASVCQAIQHAHTKGIIHRDIKPSNVLVTRQDGQSVVKVIDFGIAKAMGQQLTDETLFTSFAQMIGTPLYMSPEQAELSSTDIDTRSDVYSLGVLLYELLTGSTPVSKEQFKQAAIDEIRRIIREDEPPKPSTRISSAEAAPSIAAQRHTEPAKLTRLVRGELDWIVMKALEKDRSRRYETPSSFAADIERYLRDEPVLACPPSLAYRLRKFARRNKGPVLAASLVALALIGGVVGTTWQATRADQRRLEAEKAQKKEADARRVAQDAQRLATQRLDEVTREKVRAADAESDTRAFSEFLVNDVLAVARPKGERGGLGVDVTVKEALDAASANIAVRFQGRPRAEALARHDLGVTYRLIGDLDKSVEQFRCAYELRKKTLGVDDERTVQTGNSLAVVYQDQGLFAEAEPLCSHALDFGRRVLGEENPSTLGFMNNLAALYQEQGRYDLAEPHYVKALEISRRTQGAEHPDTLGVMSNLGGLYTDQHRFAEAEPLLVQALEARHRVSGEEHPGTLKSRYNLARLYLMQGQYAKAEPLLVKTLEARRRVLGDGHPHTLLTMNTLAGLYQEQHQLAEAEPLFVEALAGRRRVRGDRHPDTLHTMNDLAVLYWSVNRLECSIPMFEELLKAHEAQSGPDGSDTLLTMANLGVNYRDAGRLQEGMDLLEQAWERIQKRPGPLTGNFVGIPMVLAVTYDQAGQFGKSEPFYRAALEKTRQQNGQSPATSSALAQLGRNLLRQEKYADAEPLLRESLAIRGPKQVEEWAKFDSQSMLGGALSGQQKYAEAEPLLLAGYEGLQRREADIPPDSRVRLTQALERLVALYNAWNKADEADHWRKRLEAHQQTESGVSSPPDQKSSSPAQHRSRIPHAPVRMATNRALVARGFSRTRLNSRSDELGARAIMCQPRRRARVPIIVERASTTEVRCLPTTARCDTMDVSCNEVSGVIKLVREVCDLWDDPRAWREHLLHGACQLLGGHVGTILEDDYNAVPGYFGNLCVTSVVGLPVSMRTLVQPAISQLGQRKYEDVSDNVLVGVGKLWDHMRTHGWVTVAGNQITDEASYHASPFYQNFRKEIDCDDFLVSIRVVDLPRRPEAITIDRPHGAPPFGSREVTLLKLLHDEIAPLVGVRLATEEQLSRDGLSKRLRETLALLLDGNSEKQVASELKLATRTVHDYVAMLYEHFQVSSRAELLAYFIRRKPAMRPI